MVSTCSFSSWFSKLQVFRVGAYCAGMDFPLFVQMVWNDCSSTPQESKSDSFKPFQQCMSSPHSAHLQTFHRCSATLSPQRLCHCSLTFRARVPTCQGFRLQRINCLTCIWWSNAQNRCIRQRNQRRATYHTAVIKTLCTWGMGNI